MAGLTREQIAEREAAKQRADAEADAAQALNAERASLRDALGLEPDAASDEILAAVQKAKAAASAPPGEGPKANAKLPATKPYRVCIGGAMYVSPRLAVNIDGSDMVSYPSVLGQRGEEIMLTAREARRLTDLEAVKPAGEPLSYDEMDDAQLDAAVKAAGVAVTSSGADEDKPLRGDKLTALRTFDQGRGVAPT